MLTFDTPLEELPHIKRPAWLRFKRLGLETVRDLLFHFPNRYEDYATIVPIGEVEEGNKVTIKGTVTSIRAERTWKKKMLLTEAHIQDATGTIRALWFNQRFVSQTLKEGVQVRLSGKVTQDRDGLVLSGPDFERSEREATHTGRLVPVYPETAGLSSKFIRWQMAFVFQKLEVFPDPVPEDILDELHLPNLRTALTYLHFPKNEKQMLLAEKRFAFDEMLLLQLKVLQVRALSETGKAFSLPLDATETKRFITSLPFQLTGAQEKSVQEILHDLSDNKPMNRLLNGDVGSGKTVVAALGANSAIEAGYQVALLAPTEILAHQHFETFSRLFAKKKTTVALLTASFQELGSQKVSRATLLKAIQSGIPQIVIGTHALLQDDVRFEKLALIVVDEQQRFGVAQRAKLQELSYESADGSTSTAPHFLTMTATPIPRTLALTLFGNLDLSILDELPKHKKPITTKIAVSTTDREKIYQFIREEISRGRQAFIVFPLVEESKAMEEVKAATAEHVRLSEKAFPTLRLGLLHGRMKGKEKEKVMREFKEGKYHILVSTAVVEVGIDIPNATIMLIEEAERFGLSQLHQFRGRVGRGAEQSYCFLFPGKNSSAENKRLQAMEKMASGFELAEVDLKLRGPGTFLGDRQSGLPDIAMENLTNMRLIAIAREKAEGLLKKDPKLSRVPLLKKALSRFEERIHLE
ncbi:MAG: ATP-dependent DNA helicase RecG [Candidatus Moraniibacteriota bacterium]